MLLKNFAKSHLWARIFWEICFIVGLHSGLKFKHASARIALNTMSHAIGPFFSGDRRLSNTLVSIEDVASKDDNKSSRCLPISQQEVEVLDDEEILVS